MNRSCVWVLVGVLCLVAGGEARRWGGFGKIARKWGGSSSSKIGKISSPAVIKPVVVKPPPGFHSVNPGAPPPGFGGHVPGYSGLGRSNYGPPPPYPGLGHSNYGPPPPYSRFGQNNYGPPPPYPGMTRSNYGAPPYSSLGRSNYRAPPPYSSLGHSNYAPPPFPGGVGYQKGHSGTDFMAGALVGHSLSSLTRDRSYHHYYYPHNSVSYSSVRDFSGNGVETIDKYGLKSYEYYKGNTSCVTSYNAERIGNWAKDMLSEFYKTYPNEKIPVINNAGLNIFHVITKSMNFTVVKGDIIRNESLSVTCCGTQSQVYLNDLISGKLPQANCVYQHYVIPLRNLTFVPITNNTESTTASSTENINNVSSTRNSIRE